MALVGDPTHTDDYSKMKIDGRAIWICNNLDDFDYKSLYPSIMLEFNIAPNTQEGRIVIPNQVYDHENIYKIEEEKYSRGGEFVENLVTDNHIAFCHRWMHLANFEEFIEDLDEFYSDRGLGNFSNLSAAGFGSGQAPMIPVSSKVETAAIFDGSRVIKPVVFYANKPEKYNENYIRNLKEIKKNAIY